MKNEFIGRRGENAHFNFECECGYFAELGVPDKTKHMISCPDCSHLYIVQRPSGMWAKPVLISVAAALA